MVATHPVRNLIREGKSNQLMNVMATSAADGMQTLEVNLAGLIQAGIITYEDALDVSVHPKELDRALDKSLRMAGDMAYANRS
jgi:twitching motility protein PilT